MYPWNMAVQKKILVAKGQDWSWIKPVIFHKELGVIFGDNNLILIADFLMAQYSPSNHWDMI